MGNTQTAEPDFPNPNFPTQKGGTFAPSIAAGILAVSFARDFGHIAMSIWAFLIWVLVIVVIFRVILSGAVYYFRIMGFFEDRLSVAIVCSVVTVGSLFPFPLPPIQKALFVSVTSGSPILIGVTTFLTVAIPYVLTALIIGMFQEKGGKKLGGLGSVVA